MLLSIASVIIKEQLDAWSLATTWRHVWVHGPTTTWVCADVWATTCGHIGVCGLCHHWTYAVLSDMCYYLELWQWTSPNCGHSHFWVHSPAKSKVCVDDSYCHQRLYGCLESVLTPGPCRCLRGRSCWVHTDLSDWQPGLWWCLGKEGCKGPCLSSRSN